MKINIKDRKILTLGLCLILVCVFTLTIAYSALSAVLTINGNARVSAANWDIYLNNPRVTSGSATTNLPQIKTSSTLEFETTLDMPGDFYEFTVDVVNGGDLDAMIANVVKTPDLTAEQAKYLKYEVSYQNGEPITTKQILAKDTTMPIKVRIEYRKDLIASDLPTGQVVLDLSLTLEYIQSDGSGSSVKDNGVYKPVSANGDINEIGTIVTIGTEQFYTIGTEDDNVKLFSAMGITLDDNPIQSPEFNGTSFGEYRSEYSGSIIEGYVNKYKTALESNFGIDIVEARLITKDELVDNGCNEANLLCVNVPDFIISDTYWVGTAYGSDRAWFVDGNRNFRYTWVFSKFIVRPVIVISKSLIS